MHLLIRNKDRERFWSKVEKTESCWLWTGTITGSGSGMFYLDGKNMKSTRAAWLLVHGEWPGDLLVCHKCDTPLCVRPDHLWLGTSKENSEDMVAKGRAATGERNGKYTKPERTPKGDRNGARTKPESRLRGSKNANSVLTEEVVTIIKERLRAGEIPAKLARINGVSKQLIYRIRDGIVWKHVD